MNLDCSGICCKSQQQFRLRFQERLLKFLARHRSAAEAFGPTWEATLEEVPLADEEQGAVYWELIDWARSDELFTGAREHGRRVARREGAHAG